MLRNILTKITPNLRRQSGFLSPQPMTLIGLQYFESTHMNKSVEEWLKTLPEDNLKRVRLIQNEVSLIERSLNEMAHDIEGLRPNSERFLFLKFFFGKVS